MMSQQTNIQPDRRQNKNQNKRRNRVRPTSKSPPRPRGDSPMNKRDLYFALDCEMVGVGDGGKDSALARVSIVNWDNEVILDKFVRVSQPVTDYRTFVSGVKPGDLESKDAMSYKQIRVAVQNILRGKILIGHGLENDLRALKMKHPWSDTRDTATYSPYMRMTMDSNKQMSLRPRKLRDLTWEKLGRQIQIQGNAHSPIEDAVAALDLYKAVRSDWELHIQKKVNSALQVEQRRLYMLSQHFNSHISNSMMMKPAYHNHRQVPVHAVPILGRPVDPRMPVHCQPVPHAVAQMAPQQRFVYSAR